MGRSGPPLRNNADSIKALGHSAMGEPIVSDLPRASCMLGTALARLEQAVGTSGLQAWGKTAAGLDAFRWPELCRVAADAGIPTPKTRPTLDEYHQRRRAKTKAKR